jgi:hypothetical protein
LQNSHIYDEPFTVRDGINIVRYYIKSRALNGKDKDQLDVKEFKSSILKVLDEGAIRYCPDEFKGDLEQRDEESDDEESFDEELDDDTIF